MRNKSARRIVSFILAAVVVLPTLAGMTTKADTPNTPYDVTFSLGSKETQVCFNWMSPSKGKAQVQIAKTSSVKSGSFPSNSTVTGTATATTATNGGLGNASYTDATTGEYTNKATVSGLSLSTKYTYRVGDGTTWSSEYTFTTGNPGSGFSFLAFGDPQLGAASSNANAAIKHTSLADDQAGWADTLKKATSKYPSINFLFTLGDEVNNYTDLTAQQNEYKAFFTPDSSAGYLQKFALVALEGNHDEQLGKYYSYHYNQPNRSTLGETSNNSVNNNDGDYWFTYGDALFMVLNANNYADTAAHDEFMKQAVDANPNARWKIAAWHQSAYSEASHAVSSADDSTQITFIRQNWPKLMDKYGVDVVFEGHDHSYTRTYQMYNGLPVDATKTNLVSDTKGTVYFTLDSGSGSKYYDFQSTAVHTFSSLFWQQYAPTYSYITIDDNEFKIDTIRTDTGDSVDHYTIDKTPLAPASSSQPDSNSTVTSTPSGRSSSSAGNIDTGDSFNGSIPIAVSSTLGILVLIAIAAALIARRKQKD
ncbi:MAG: metallophosphoesterase family protein [Clostridia bacterium]|nr:metallophosphoesterase family protein [Clostridia bacterium]